MCIRDRAGSSPLENAQAKAACYGQFWEYVITQDAALYIRELALDDPRQPGLTVRRRPDGHVMTDEEAIAHYAGLAHELGGRMTCWYQEGYAVANHGKVTGFMDDEMCIRDREEGAEFQPLRGTPAWDGLLERLEEKKQ